MANVKSLADFGSDDDSDSGDHNEYYAGGEKRCVCRLAALDAVFLNGHELIPLPPVLCCPRSGQVIRGAPDEVSCPCVCDDLVPSAACMLSQMCACPSPPP